MNARKILDKGLRFTPAPLFLRRGRSRLSVLAYHALDDAERFREHLAILRELTNPVSLSDVVNSCDGEHPLPDNAVLVTFDDNDRSIAEIAVPLLTEMEVPAVAFVIAGCLLNGNQPWFAELESLARTGISRGRSENQEFAELKRALKSMTDSERLTALEEIRRSATRVESDKPQLRPEDLLTLTAANIEIGNHTLTHPCLPRCTSTKIRTEISDAHKILTEIIGRPPRAIAYPNGDYDNRVISAAADLDYAVGFLFDHKSNALPIRDRLCISRLRVNSRASNDRFVNIVSGLHPALHEVRSRVTRSLVRR